MVTRKKDALLVIVIVSLLVQCEIRHPPRNFQEAWKFPGVLEISRGPGFFQALEIFRAPENFQVSVYFIPMENSREGTEKCISKNTTNPLTIYEHFT